jgi:ATP-dependent protease HslVU (ClpYQ) peptidase subunit
MEHAVLVHSPEYANWVFDPTHPTQGRRFLHARNQLMLRAQERRLNVYEIEPEMPHTDDLHSVTTIIAVQYDDKAVIGADSQTTGATGRKASHAQMVKVTQRGDFIVAGSGECAPCDIAQHIWVPPVPSAKDWNNLYHFMIAKVVPSLKACFKENEYKWDVEDDETKFAFLMIIGGEIFEIADDFSVCLDGKGYYGVGSGSDFAIGALSAGATLKEALKIASDNDAFTSPPFIYHTQQKRQKVASRPKK